MENQEALKTRALVSQFPNSVQDKVNDLFANSVVPSGIVIGSIFLACDELLRMEELAVGASAKFIDDCGFQVRHCPGYMLASTHLTEGGVEGVISSPSGLVTWHLAIGLNAVFQAVELQLALPIGHLPGQRGSRYSHAWLLLGGCRVGGGEEERLLLLTA